MDKPVSDPLLDMLNKVADAPAADKLTPEQQSQVYRVLSGVPVVGLPHGGMGVGVRPQTWTEVLAVIEHMGNRMGVALRENEQLRSEIAGHRSDLAVIRRVLGTEQ